MSYNSEGVLRWFNRYSLPFCNTSQTKLEEGVDIALTKQGFICVTGYGYCPGCDEFGNHPNGSGHDIVTLWYTPNGTLTKEKVFSRFRNGSEAGFAVFAGNRADYVTGMSMGGNSCSIYTDVEAYIPILKLCILLTVRLKWRWCRR